MLGTAVARIVASMAMSPVASMSAPSTGPRSDRSPTEARSIEDKRAELAALPAEQRLSQDDVVAIRAIGDNTGCMALKGANPQHEGEERPDRWPLTEDLAEVGSRWGIDPGRDLVASH